MVRMHNVFTASSPLTSLKTPRICRKWLAIIALLFGSVLGVAQDTPAPVAPGDARSLGHPSRVFLGTAAGELYLSTSASGNSHSQVSTVVADRSHPDTIYAGVISDQEFGGVFVTHDGGKHWQQMNSGLAGHDIFSLAQTSHGDLVAGTQRGIYVYSHQLGRWSPENLVVNEKVTATRTPKLKNAKMTTRKEYVRAQLKGRVARVIVFGERWYAATSEGVYASYDQGHSWHGGPVRDEQNFLSIDAYGEKVVASSPDALAISNRHGVGWTLVDVPSSAGTVSNVAASPSAIWISSQAGVFCSHDDGATWEHVTVGSPSQNLVSARYDSINQRMLGLSESGEVYATTVGQSWTYFPDASMRIRSFNVAGGQLMAVTPFRGVKAQPEARSLPKETRTQ